MEWKLSSELIPYEESLAAMEQRVADIRSGAADEMVWLLEHPPLYTGGTSAKANDLIEAQFPVYETGRGGQYTYHGPGQRIAYVMLDLKKRSSEPDIRVFVKQLEQWLINTLAAFDIAAGTRDGRIGVWVDVESNNEEERPVGRPSLEPASLGAQQARAGSTHFPPKGEMPKNEKKIAALGIRVRHWVTFHGVALNVNPDLSHYAGIVPCGISEFGVTSMHEMGATATMEKVDGIMKQEFEKLF